MLNNGKWTDVGSILGGIYHVFAPFLQVLGGRHRPAAPIVDHSLRATNSGDGTCSPQPKQYKLQVKPDISHGRLKKPHCYLRWVNMSCILSKERKDPVLMTLSPSLHRASGEEQLQVYDWKPQNISLWGMTRTRSLGNLWFNTSSLKQISLHVICGSSD